MLLRETRHSTWECISQEHHALLSGCLAGAWAQSHLDPLLVSAIGLHDTAWRPVDRRPRFEDDTGLPYDFRSYPLDDKIDFYRSGLDDLESVDPYAAYLVSLHYTTVAGTRDVERLQEDERRRRERLAERLPDPLVSGAEVAVDWMKFFDIFSLHVCLTGPESAPDSIPRWLQDPSDWSQSPDGTSLELAWRDDATLEVAPWPFDKAELSFELHYRLLERRFDSARALEQAWESADFGRRSLTFVAG